MLPPQPQQRPPGLRRVGEGRLRHEHAQAARHIPRGIRATRNFEIHHGATVPHRIPACIRAVTTPANPENPVRKRSRTYSTRDAPRRHPPRGQVALPLETSGPASPANRHAVTGRLTVLAWREQACCFCLGSCATPPVLERDDSAQRTDFPLLELLNLAARFQVRPELFLSNARRRSGSAPKRCDSVATAFVRFRALPCRFALLAGF